MQLPRQQPNLHDEWPYTARVKCLGFYETMSSEPLYAATVLLLLGNLLLGNCQRHLSQNIHIPRGIHLPASRNRRIGMRIGE